MRKIMLTAMNSGAGKTVMTCALLAAFRRRGDSVTAFKSGPDYIDPMFHTRVLGIPSRNLDLFLQGEAGVLRTLNNAGEGLAVLEGAMGYYDGLAGTTRASAWDLARATRTPTLLVLRPRGAGISLAAQVKGMQIFRADSRLVGLLLCDCADRMAAWIKLILERETGLPVLGYLPPMPEAEWESRHLGLMTPDTVTELQRRIESMAAQAERSIDLDAIWNLAAQSSQRSAPAKAEKERCRIAVARDEAFCFYYEDNLDKLRVAGAELLFFSPLRDAAIPDVADGLYLGGGYPELYAGQLSENAAMRQSIRDAVKRGIPTVAECGGFLYLQQSLEDAHGQKWDMCGCLPGQGYRTARLQRFGYQTLQTDRSTMLLQPGESLPAHEFHYWDSTDNGADLISQKANGRSWACGFANERLYAAFPHLHFGGELPLAERFVAACCRG